MRLPNGIIRVTFKEEQRLDWQQRYLTQLCDILNRYINQTLSPRLRHTVIALAHFPSKPSRIFEYEAYSLGCAPGDLDLLCQMGLLEKGEDDETAGSCYYWLHPLLADFARLMYIDAQTSFSSESGFSF